LKSLKQNNYFVKGIHFSHSSAHWIEIHEPKLESKKELQEKKSSFMDVFFSKSPEITHELNRLKSSNLFQFISSMFHSSLAKSCLIFNSTLMNDSLTNSFILKNMKSLNFIPLYFLFFFNFKNSSILSNESSTQCFCGLQYK
jgi:hypothetical protein